MLKVLSIIGTRPEIIKMAPVLKVFAKYPDKIQSKVCLTGQHTEILKPMLDLFSIKADFDLDVMRQNQTLVSSFSSMINKLDPLVVSEKPDWIVAQGDTTSVVVASIISYYNQVKFAHVEAGLRTSNLREPFPEEGNRIISDALAEKLFAPTLRAKENLLKENISEDKIELVGNTVVDALQMVKNFPYHWNSSPLKHIPKNNRLVLVTAHRRENFGKPIEDICYAIKELARSFEGEGVNYVYPVHPNPNVKEPVIRILSSIQNVHLIEPLDYLSLINLMKKCVLILTDSGGIQEEAPSLQVPVLVLRDTTERPEGIDIGVSCLIGTRKEKIIEIVTSLLKDNFELNKMKSAESPYGDGNASVRIAESLIRNV